MPYISIDQIKREVSCWAVLEAYQWRFTSNTSKSRRGPCPFHTARSKRPRTFYTEFRWWFCHKCQKGGDVIDLVIALTGLSFADALCDLRDNYMPKEVQPKPPPPPAWWRRRRTRDEER